MAINYTKNLAENRLSTPFELELNDQAAIVYCDKIIRHVPGKRIVAFGSWDGKPVVAKLFFEFGKAKRHLSREVAGIKSLVAAGIPTPALLFHGKTKNKKISVLLLEKINHSKSLEEIGHTHFLSEKSKKILTAMIIELATQHVLGIVQEDLHFKNFLVKGKNIFTLDGGSVRYFPGGPLSKKTSLKHLGLFFSQLGVGTDDLQRHLFQIYTKSRGWLVKPADIKFLNTSIQKWNNVRWSNYEKKIFRNCTAFSAISTARLSGMYDRSYQSEAFLKLLHDPETIFNHPHTEIVKAGRTATVARFIWNQKKFIIKRYNIKHIFHGLRRCLRPTRSAVSWRLAHLLRLFGIPTAKPIAYIENRILGLRGKSYFIMEEINGIDLASYFSNIHGREDKLLDVAEKVAALLKNLTLLKITHGDLKATNILVETIDQDTIRPVLIDLDGMRQHTSQREMAHAFKADIKRFMKNWNSHSAVHALFRKLLTRV